MEELRNDRFTIRSAVTSNDSAVPTTAQTAYNGGAYRYAIVEASIIGTSNMSADLTPLYWDDSSNAYMKGEPRTITASGDAGSSLEQREVYTIPMLGYTDFYVLVDGLTGTNPSVTVAGIPYSY